MSMERDTLFVDNYRMFLLFYVTFGLPNRFKYETTKMLIGHH